MKLSQFNNVVPYNESVVLYNAFSNRYLLVDPLLNDLIESAKAENNIDDLIGYHPTFYTALVTNGFIVDNERDELESVKMMRMKVDMEDESQYHLIINPTMNCNFKCWYCYEAHEKGSKMSNPTIEHVKKHISNVVQSMPDIKFFNISWFGGEPLLYYDQVIVPVMDYVKEFFRDRSCKFSTGFTTNGFLINEKMIADFPSFNITNFQITLDGDRETHDAVRFVSSKRGSYDEILANVFALCRNKMNVSIRINYTKSNLKNLESILYDFLPLEEEARKYMLISFHKVWQETDVTLTGRIRELHRFFRNNGFRATFADMDMPDGLRNSCYADKKNHATINYNGEVFKCTARNFSTDAKEGMLNEDGSISWSQKFYDRLDSKFKNKPCLTCPILPICNGGCSQEAIEHKGQDYCMYDFDEQRKKNVVLNKYINLLQNSVA